MRSDKIDRHDHPLCYSTTKNYWLFSDLLIAKKIDYCYAVALLQAIAMQAKGFPFLQIVIFSQHIFLKTIFIGRQQREK